MKNNNINGTLKRNSEINLLYFEAIHSFKQNVFLSKVGISPSGLNSKQEYFNKVIENINLGDLKKIRSKNKFIEITSDSYSVTITASNLLIYIDEFQFLIRFFANRPKYDISFDTLIKPKLHPDQIAKYDKMLNNNSIAITPLTASNLWKDLQILLQSKVKQNDRSFPFNIEWNVNAVFEIIDENLRFRPVISSKPHDFEIIEIGLSYPKTNDRLRLSRIRSRDMKLLGFINVNIPVNNLFHGILSTVLKPIELEYNLERISEIMTSRLQEKLDSLRMIGDV